MAEVVGKGVSSDASRTQFNSIAPGTIQTRQSTKFKTISTAQIVKIQAGSAGSQTVAGMASHRAILADSAIVEGSDQTTQTVERVYIVARGTSFHAGQAGGTVDSCVANAAGGGVAGSRSSYIAEITIFSTGDAYASRIGGEGDCTLNAELCVEIAADAVGICTL